MNNNLKEIKVEVPIGCLDGRTSRYERRQIKVARAKLLSKQNLIFNLDDNAIYWRPTRVLFVCLDVTLDLPPPRAEPEIALDLALGCVEALGRMELV